MAMVFWAEPTVTFDLDVFVFLPPISSPIVSLEPLYGVLRARGFEPTGEHVMIHGVPVQFLVSPGELADEAIETAGEQRVDDVPFRVMRPEHQVRDRTMRDAAPRPGRARPSQALLDRQREEKARWRRALAQRPFREKVAMVLELQRRLHPVPRTRRAMRWWEHPWNIDV